MTNMKLFLELIARGSGFNTELNRSGRAVTRFTQGAKREFAELRRMAGSLQGTLASIGLTVGVIKVAMDSARLDKSLTQIGQTAGASAAEVRSLRSDLFRMGRDSGQSVEDLKSGFDALVQSGLNMREAKSTLDGVNVAMAVTGANANTLAGGLTVAAEAFQFDLSKPGQALELLDKMTVAGRLGNAELHNLADIFARVGVNAKSAGMDFDKTLAFIEGLSKIERNPERLATLADSTLRVFNNLNYQGAAEKATGVKFFNASGGRRDALEVVDDLRKKYQLLATDKQRALFIQAAFGKADLDTIKGIKTLMSGDVLPQVKQFSETIKDAGGTMKRDFSEATRNLVDQVGMLKNDLREAADGFVKPINEALGKFIQHLRKPKEQGGMGFDGKDMIGAGAAAVVGGLLLKRYGGKVGGALIGKLTGYKSVAQGVAEGKILQAAAGVTPVFVTNWPGGVPGWGPGIPGNGNYDVFRTPDYLGRSPLPGGAGGGRIATFAGRAGYAGLAAFGGYEVGTFINRGWGRAAEAWTGGKYKGEGWLGEMIYDALHREKEQKNDIVINMNIEGNGRETISTNGMNNRVNTVKRGSFFSFSGMTNLPPVGAY